MKFNRKGLTILSEQMFILFELVAIGLITIALLKYTSQFGSNEFFERRWISEDVSMFVETAVSAPLPLATQFMWPAKISIDKTGAAIDIERNTVTIATKQTKDKLDFKTTEQYAYPNYTKFSKTGTNMTDFMIVSNGKSFSVSPIRQENSMALACERYKQSVSNAGKIPVLGFESGNEKILVLLMDYFTKGTRSALYSVKSSGKRDVYINIDCITPTPLYPETIYISSPLVGNQKLACLLSEKLGLNYKFIVPKQDEKLTEDAEASAHILFNCDVKRLSAIASAVEEYFD
jgi:hypothetical protein